MLNEASNEIKEEQEPEQEEEYYSADYLAEFLTAFFEKDENHEIFLRVRTKRFLRVIYHGIMASKEHNIALYDLHMNISKGFPKHHYDIYARGFKKICYDVKERRIVLTPNKNTIVTTLGQMNMIMEFLIKRKKLQYFIENEALFRKQLSDKKVHFKEKFVIVTSLKE